MEGHRCGGMTSTFHAPSTISTHNDGPAARRPASAPAISRPVRCAHGLADDSLSLTPVTLLPPLPKPSGDRVPSSPVPYPQLQDGFQLSPTSNYQAPYGQSSLGETLRARVRLHNVTTGPVYGVKMMMEVQSPGGRMRLGEVVHGGARPEGMDPSQAETRAWNELPILAPGEGVELAGEHELAELGMHILICSVAWETESGRRTFQRFLKFNVSVILPH